MTALLSNSLAPRASVARPGPPRLRAVCLRTLESLTIAVIAPAVVFWAAMVAFNVYAAVSVALAWMVAAMGWRWVKGRPVSRLLLLTVGIMTIRTAFTLGTGNTFVYFVQPVFADAVVAVIFLSSLWTARPLVARLAPDFYPVDADIAERPRVRRLFRRLTLLWGVVVVAKGTMTLWLLLTRSTVDFVLIKSAAIITLTLLASAASVVLAAVVARQEGLLRPHDAATGAGRRPSLSARTTRRNVTSTTARWARGRAPLEQGCEHRARHSRRLPDPVMAPALESRVALQPIRGSA